MAANVNFAFASSSLLTNLQACTQMA